MAQDDLKRSVGIAAVEYIDPLLTPKSIVGVGTGSTANYFIDALATIRHKFDAAVASSEASAARLEQLGITVLDLNSVSEVCVYVDGADEIDLDNNLIKGGGGALTREKIVAASADEFVCIADDSKLVEKLGAYPLPVEVVPMARGLVARALAAFGEPVLREGFTTDNGNIILDVHGLSITDPAELEVRINNLVGVVCNGIFAANGASQVLLASADGIIQR